MSKILGREAPTEKNKERVAERRVFECYERKITLSMTFGRETPTEKNKQREYAAERKDI